MTPLTNQKLVEACKKLQKIMIEECRAKHMCDPREDSLNPDYHVTMTISFGEMKDFIRLLREASAPMKEFAGMTKQEWENVANGSTWPKLPKVKAACRKIADSLCQ